jgi:hypothetical protein
MVNLTYLVHVAATWTATSSRKRAQTCSRERTQWRIRDIGRGPFGQPREGERRQEGRTGADANGANGFLGADRSGRYGYVGADVSGRYWYVGADATVGIVRWART